MEIYEYLKDIMHLENSDVVQLSEKTGITAMKLRHFFSPEFKKNEQMIDTVAAALSLPDPELPPIERIAAYYREKLYMLLGSAEEIFIENYCALPALEQRYLRAIARNIAYLQKRYKNNSDE